MRRFLALFLCVLLFPCFAFAELTVYFLDVGQGDSAIIVCDGEAMIIDGGLRGYSDYLFSFIVNSLQINRFDYMVATHPDNDHIGGLTGVLEAAKKINKKIKYIYSPIKLADSEEGPPRFKELTNRANEYGAKIKIPHDKDKESLGDATVTFYNCDQKKRITRVAVDWFKSLFNKDEPEENKENNDMSLVVKITYGETSFLFTGDIEKDAEGRLISSGVDLSADVLKVAHHGSSSSSSIDFLEKVNPKYAVISCGAGNGYRHPEQVTLDEFKQKNIDLYRTDLQGIITCRSDGHSITFETEKTAHSDLFKAPEKQ